MRLKRKQGDCGRINIGSKRDPECDAIPGIPAAARADSIKKHIDAKTDPLVEARFLGKPNRSDLLKSDQTERCRNHPTRGVRHPAPAVFRRIESDAVVERLKLPAPEPGRL